MSLMQGFATTLPGQRVAKQVIKNLIVESDYNSGYLLFRRLAKKHEALYRPNRQELLWLIKLLELQPGKAR